MTKKVKFLQCLKWLKNASKKVKQQQKNQTSIKKKIPTDRNGRKVPNDTYREDRRAFVLTNIIKPI